MTKTYSFRDEHKVATISGLEVTIDGHVTKCKDFNEVKSLLWNSGYFNNIGNYFQMPVDYHETGFCAAFFKKFGTYPYLVDYIRFYGDRQADDLAWEQFRMDCYRSIDELYLLHDLRGMGKEPITVGEIFLQALIDDFLGRRWTCSQCLYYGTEECRKGEEGANPNDRSCAEFLG